MHMMTILTFFWVWLKCSLQTLTLKRFLAFGPKCLIWLFVFRPKFFRTKLWLIWSFNEVFSRRSKCIALGLPLSLFVSLIAAVCGCRSSKLKKFTKGVLWIERMILWEYLKVMIGSDWALCESLNEPSTEHRLRGQIIVLTELLSAIEKQKITD